MKPVTAAFFSAALALAAVCGKSAIAAERPTPLNEQPQLRRPVALAIAGEAQRLFVANRRTGSISVLETPSLRVLGEFPVARKLSDLTLLDEHGKWLAATDEASHHLLLLHWSGSAIEVRQRLEIASYPVRVVADRDANRCYVSSLWSRRLTAVDVDLSRGTLTSNRATDVTIAPRDLLLLPDAGRLLVADSFAGRFEVVDTSQLKPVGGFEFPGHNIRGLALAGNGRMLVFPHQMLNELAHTVRNDVHWGLLMSNDLRWFELKTVLTPGVSGKDVYHGGHMHPLGDAGDATADPTGIDISAAGTVVVALAGVGEIAYGRESDYTLRRIKVGRRPTAVCFGPDEKVYVANTFDDSISRVDLGSENVEQTQQLGPLAELSLADRGELLFFDGRLSHDGWMSCHSCHTDGHTNGLLNDNFSDHSFGAPKRVLSLLGKRATAPFSWNGGVPDLETQIQRSIQNTMQAGDAPKPATVAALKAFVESLPAPPSIDAARKQIDLGKVARGQSVFRSSGCIECHQAPTYTSTDAYDVGLTDQQKNTQFNPPSLRGVGQRMRLFHDNRAASLTEVLTKYRHQLTRDLTPAEVDDLVAFLRSL